MDPKHNLQSNPGCKYMILQKLSRAVICSVLSQALFLVLFCITDNVRSFWQPVTWLHETVHKFTSLSTWIYFVPLGSVVFAQSVICAKDYVYRISPGESRFKRLCLIFTLRNTMIGLLHVVVAIILVWLHLSLSSSHRICSKNDKCINEETLFIACNGLWIGVYYFLQVYISDEKNMVFPVIHLKKMAMFKSRIGTLARTSVKQALWPLYMYVIVYYIWGGSIRNWISYNLQWHVDEQSLFLNFYMIFSTFLFNVFYLLNMGCMRLFFEVFLTEKIQFSIATMENQLCLSNALTMDNLPVVQHLAALDLFLLSTNDASRRQQLFTLSQPGGHPHNWNSLLNPALKLLHNYTSLLNISAESLLGNEHAKVQEVPPCNPPVAAKPAVIQSPTRFTNLRNMSMPRSEPVELITMTESPLTHLKNNLLQKAAAKFNSLINATKSKLGWKYFFGEMPEANIRLCLSNGQVICWTVQGLSFVCSASKTEDPFGVVQKDLASVITALVLLKKSVEKLFKLNKKGSFSDFQLKMRFALKSSIRRSLYNISKSFGDYLYDLPLSPDIRTQMENYVNCKEG